MKRRIRAMSDRWGYDDDDLHLALAGAGQDPAGWLAVVEADEALGITVEDIYGGGNEVAVVGGSFPARPHTAPKDPSFSPVTYP